MEKTQVRAALFVVTTLVGACNAVLGFDDLQEGDCSQNARRCAPNGTNTVQLCEAGQWVDDPQGACVETTCSAGACVGECAPGKRCVGTRIETCVDGTWQLETECFLPLRCTGGVCLNECVPGDQRCSEDLREKQACSAQGEWQAQANACTGKTCDPFTVTCIGVCPFGEKRCNGNIPQTCNANGEWTSAEECVGGQVCVDGTCMN